MHVYLTYPFVLKQVIALCEDPAERARLGAQARAFAVGHYDLEKHCLPRQIAWVAQLAGD